MEPGVGTEDAATAQVRAPPPQHAKGMRAGDPGACAYVIWEDGTRFAELLRGILRTLDRASGSTRRREGAEEGAGYGRHYGFGGSGHAV